MFDTRSFIIATVAAAVISGITVGGNNQAASDPAPIVKDQSRVGDDSAWKVSGAVPSQAVSVVRGTKGDRTAVVDCDSRSWPYVPAPCLVGAGGEARSAATRTITVERPTAIGSILERVPMPQVASQ